MARIYGLAREMDIYIVNTPSAQTSLPLHANSAFVSMPKTPKEITYTVIIESRILDDVRYFTPRATPLRLRVGVGLGFHKLQRTKVRLGNKPR